MPLEGQGWAGRGAGLGTWPGAASRARDPPRAGEGLGWGGAANLGGQRDRPAVGAIDRLQGRVGCARGRGCGNAESGNAGMWSG